MVTKIVLRAFFADVFCLGIRYIFNRKKGIYRCNGDNYKAGRKIDAVIIGYEFFINAIAQNQQHIVRYCKDTDNDCNTHKNKSIKNKVPAYIRWKAEHPLGPGTQFSEKIHIDKVIIGKPGLSDNNRFSFKVEKHHKRNKDNYTQLN
jgi:hypothetical protein